MSPVEAVAGGQLDAAAVRRLWPEVLEAIKIQNKRKTHALLSVYAQVVEVTGRTLTLSFSTEPIRRQFLSGTNEDVLCEALAQVLGIDCKIETVGGGLAAEVGRPADVAPVQSAVPAYEGFAPGDEAADDTDEPGEQAARVDPEQAAVGPACRQSRGQGHRTDRRRLTGLTHSGGVWPFTDGPNRPIPCA